MKTTVLAFATIILVSLFFVNATTSTTTLDLGVYDPWCDQDSDGDIDIYDIVTAAVAFDTTGDPTKTVYVQNWPVTNQQTVFYGQSSSAGSEFYNASGFGHLHLLWFVSALSDTEYVTLKIRARIYPESGIGLPILINIQSLDITPSNDVGAISFPVPCETFSFYISFPAGTDASVYLAYYLTYA